MLVILLLSSPLLLLGATLYYKAENLPLLLKWWGPTTKRLRSYIIDERYSKKERIKIDGVALFVFGIGLMFWFSLMYLFVVLEIVGEGLLALIALAMLATLGPTTEYFSVVILRRNDILHSDDSI